MDQNNIEIKTADDWNRFCAKVPFDPETECALVVIVPSEGPLPETGPRIITANDFGANPTHLWVMLTLATSQPMVREVARMYSEAMAAREVLSGGARRSDLVVAQQVPPVNLR